MSSLFKKLAPIAAIAAPIAFPGIGAALGGSILGAGAAGSATLGNALIGGGLGLASGGGLKGALGGAALGGIGANLGSVGAIQGPVQAGGQSLGYGGTGILGSIGRASPTLGSALSGLGSSTGSLVGGSPLSSGSLALNILGGYQQDEAIKKAMRQQQAALTQAEGNLGQFSPEDYLNSPAYQFQLDEGQRAMDRTNAARGSFFSGNALREAQQFGQGLGAQYYEPAYNRYAQETDERNKLLLQRAGYGGQGALMRSNNIADALRFGQYGV